MSPNCQQFRNISVMLRQNNGKSQSSSLSNKPLGSYLFSLWWSIYKHSYRIWFVCCATFFFYKHLANAWSSKPNGVLRVMCCIFSTPVFLNLLTSFFIRWVFDSSSYSRQLFKWGSTQSKTCLTCPQFKCSSLCWSWSTNILIADSIVIYYVALNGSNGRIPVFNEYYSSSWWGPDIFVTMSMLSLFFLFEICDDFIILYFSYWVSYTTA